MTTLSLAVLVGCGDGIDVTIKETPIRILSDKAGYGRAAKPGDLVTISYVVILPDGKELMRHDEFRFEVGAQAVIRGIDEAVRGMRTHGTRVVECPPHKHWGRAGYGDGAVPRNTTLIIHIEVTDIE